MRPRALTLDDDERVELVQIREPDRRPYLREWAAALLKIAAGQSPRQVALTGLHRPRHPRTVRRWLTKYEEGGLAALIQLPRGRRGLSPPPIGGNQTDRASRAGAARRGPQSVAAGRSATGGAGVG